MTVVENPPLRGVDLLMTDPEWVVNDRSIDLRWTLSEREVREFDRPDGEIGIERIFAELSIQHWGRREMYGWPEYCFTARLSHGNRTDFKGSWRTSLGIGAPAVEIGRTDCNRFSAKRIREFAETMLVELRTRRDDETVRLFFEHTHLEYRRD